MFGSASSPIRPPVLPFASHILRAAFSLLRCHRARAVSLFLLGWSRWIRAHGGTAAPFSLVRVPITRALRVHAVALLLPYESGAPDGLRTSAYLSWDSRRIRRLLRQTLQHPPSLDCLSSVVPSRMTEDLIPIQLVRRCKACVNCTVLGPQR